MESISYLHKKFKKQLSIDPKYQNNDKEKKDSIHTVESSEKKNIVTKIHDGKSYNLENQSRIENNECVPNRSTNENSPAASVLNRSNFPKSSISVEKHLVNQQSQQSSNSYISHVISNNEEDEHYKSISFDRTFSSNPNSTTSTTTCMSSISESVGCKKHYKDDEIYNLQEDKTHSAQENIDVKTDEIQPPPDRSLSGKYVCTYCNLVCSKPSVLQKHIRAHTNERPYPCISCGFSFKTRSNLYKHCRSRTHANRVMGNKSHESGSDTDAQKITTSSKNPLNVMESKEERYQNDFKEKPYKPRFHTTKQFFESVSKENIEDEVIANHSNSDLISHHINEIINKNNSIVNSNEKKIASKRYDEHYNNNLNDYIQHNSYRNETVSSSSTVIKQKSCDEPLNLTSKNRKRCMSEIAEPVAQKSLIKELLLKNLYSNDMQCPYCKMIFQTVTELDVHKYRNCKGKPSGAKYTRSSSVNVASILTQNKNAFDNIPQFHNTVFPLNSPGPFLGKTRLVEGDKSKSFSFDGGKLPLMSSSDMPSSLLPSLNFDRDKKPVVKLFGGEVKIHSSGETKTFKIDQKDDSYDSETLYIGGKLSENRVIKSGLNSGGTVLTNKTNYNKQDYRMTQDVIRVYETTPVGPHLPDFRKEKFNFDNLVSPLDQPMDSSRQRLEQNEQSKSLTPSPLSSKYSNVVDFSQKILSPTIRQPNFCVSASPIQNKMVYSPLSIENNINVCLESPRMKNLETVKHMEEITPRKKQFGANSVPISQRTMYYEQSPTTTTSLCNPMNLLVNGKVVRYVPGMPGPVAAEDPDISYGSNVVAVRTTQKEIVVTPVVPTEKPRLVQEIFKKNFLQPEKRIDRINKGKQNETFEDKTDNFIPIRSHDQYSSPRLGDSKSPIKLPEVKSIESKIESKKFVRPNSLALKPTTASLKQHHGLTPTMFNQILISPDTPRVAKKYAEHFLHGNYFSYLGLKSSTKPVYCTLNKTQPFYVPHFKKLSMYSEWRQQDTKPDKLYVSNYDSRQKSQKYSVAGKTSANLIIHSSYKFMISEIPSSNFEHDSQKMNAVLGGYECNEDYTYIRGRGRGRYVCDQCGIRCKKPSMLKKHIRTHSNDRPFTCSHCNFSFKTKGNLTKHMKSKAHTKNYTASSGSNSSTQQSTTQSSESDTDDSGMDSSDESTRHQEHEAAYGLLSLSQKPSKTSTSGTGLMRSSSPVLSSDLFMSTEEIVHMSKTNYAKNKILDERCSASFSGGKNVDTYNAALTEESTEAQKISNYLGKSCLNRPLTYPYMSGIHNERDVLTARENLNEFSKPEMSKESTGDQKCIKQFHVIQKYAVPESSISPPPKVPLKDSLTENLKMENAAEQSSDQINVNSNRVLPTLRINNIPITATTSDLRKRKNSSSPAEGQKTKVQRNYEVMDLSMTTSKSVKQDDHIKTNGLAPLESNLNNRPEIISLNHGYVPLKNVAAASKSPQKSDSEEEEEDEEENINFINKDVVENVNGTVIILKPLQSYNDDHTKINYNQEQSISNDQGPTDYDNSAMETLADVATKQVKLEKNTLAKSVATEFLKLATKNDNPDGSRDSGSYVSVNKDVNNIMVKSEGNKSCAICSKSFSKPSQLRLHMNIHYLERPFRCDSCSVSFRTKGHLQKHERSASHHNKLSSSPALSSSEPRPFKCSDCNIAFRIHGHLAKHLRSKMHIMKLECLAKVPFGLYAELERSNSLLTEINTSDGDQCLESLKTLAKKVFIHDSNKLNRIEIHQDNVNANS